MLFNRINCCPTWLHTFPTFAWRVKGKPLASRQKIKLSIWLWKLRSAAPPHFNYEGKTYLHHHFTVQWTDHADHKTANLDQNSIVFGLSGRCKTHCVITIDTTIHSKDNPIGMTHDMHSIHRHARLCTEAVGGLSNSVVYLAIKLICLFTFLIKLLLMLNV
jgi:hypothetical protein